MKDCFNHVYHALYSRENVYNRQPKMQARFSFFGKEFSFKDIDKTKFEQDKARNNEILRNAYLANTEDLAGVDSSNIFDFIKQQESSSINSEKAEINSEKADKTIAEEFFLDVELYADKKTIKNAEKHKDNTGVLDVAESQLNYKLRLSEHIPQNCTGVVVVAVGAHNTLLGAKKHYRELIQWNKQHPDKKMGMIFFDYRGAGLSDNIEPEDLNSDQAVINDVKAVIKYASSLGKPLCLSGTCFGTGPVTGAVCQLSQECESDDDFQKKYNIKGILRSLEYSTFASVARKQQDYLKPFWHNIVATFGAPYRSATLTSLSNVHDVSYIPSSIPISTYQATRPRWTHEEPLTSKDFSSNNRDVKGFFGGMVESFFQSILLRPGDAMMGLEQAYKNWAIKDNPGRYLIDPTKSHSEGVGFTDEKLACLADMFDYNCGQNQQYTGSIKKPSEIEPEVVRPFSNEEEYQQKQTILHIFSRYQELVQKTNQGNIDDCGSDDFEKILYEKVICTQSTKLRDCLNKLPQEHKQEILTKLNCQEIFGNEKKLFDLETFESLVKELKEYQKHFGKCLRKRYIDGEDVKGVFTKVHPFYNEVAKEFEKTDKQELWYKIYQDQEDKKKQLGTFIEELTNKIKEPYFSSWLTQKAQEIGIENQDTGDVSSNIGEISKKLVGEISKKLKVRELEANIDGIESEYYKRQKDIKSLDTFLQSMQPNAIAETQSKLQRDYDLTREAQELPQETKLAINYYKELYLLKSKLNPEKYVTKEARAGFRENKKELRDFYQKILQDNIEYAIAGQFFKDKKELNHDNFNEYKKTFVDIKSVSFANVKTKHQELQELQQAEVEKVEEKKLYLTSHKGDLSPTGVHHQVDYGERTPQEAFLKKVTDADYMKAKIAKWHQKLPSSASPSGTTKPDGFVTCPCSLFL